MKPRCGTTILAIVFLMFLANSCTGEESQTSSPRPTFVPPPTYTPIPTVVEPGLAYGIPCKPPCWQNLIPGESTSQDVEREMERLRVSEWAYSVVGVVEGGRGDYHVRPSPFTIGGSIHVKIEEDTITRIMGNVLFDYHVGTLVEQLELGGPEGLYIVGGSGGCDSCEEWEPAPADNVPGTHGRYHPVHLLYPNKGMWFLMLVPLNGWGCICPEMEVVAFCYYDPVSMEEALKDNYLQELCGAQLSGVIEEDLTEWHGFGGGY